MKPLKHYTKINIYNHMMIVHADCKYSHFYKLIERKIEDPTNRIVMGNPTIRSFIDVRLRIDALQEKW